MKKVNYPIIFVHVPRSGGTTLNSILQNNFPASRQFSFYVTEDEGSVDESMNKFKSISPAEKQKFLLLTGHVNFGIHHYYNDKFTYITMFRDPVQRILSYYSYILKKEDHYLHSIVVKNRLKVNDILRNKISVEFDNAQVRQISGIAGVSFGECNQAMLDKAKENLDKYYSMFGITERFNESLVFMKNYFGLPQPFYTSLNQTQDKGLIKTPAETIEAIKELNKYDLDFYAYANKRFDELTAGYGWEFDALVNNFNKKNDAIQKLRLGKMNYGLKAWQMYTKFNGYVRSKNL
jgi:hypothetical protein